MRLLHWKDPDTDVVHIIRTIGAKRDRPEVTRAESSFLYVVVGEETTRQFSRTVTMCCGEYLDVDSDEFIASKAQENVLRPWLTGHEPPTCLACMVASTVTEYQDDWTIRGL